MEGERWCLGTLLHFAQLCWKPKATPQIKIYLKHKKKKKKAEILRLSLLGNHSYILLALKQFGLNFLSLEAKGVLSNTVALVKATFISESMAIWKLEGSGAKECWKWKGSCWITSSKRDSFKDGETESQRGDVCASARPQEWERDLDLTSTSLSLSRLFPPRLGRTPFFYNSERPLWFVLPFSLSLLVDVDLFLKKKFYFENIASTQKVHK